MSKTPTREFVTVPDPQRLAEVAARHLIARIEQNDGRIAICLTGGSTPARLYELLSAPPWRDRIPWPRVHWFLTDDRFVPENDLLSNGGMARRTFLDTCAPAENVHLIDTAAPTPDDAARRYEDELRAFRAAQPDLSAPLFDLVLMGIGPDGHTASLFPGMSAPSVRERWVVGVPQANVAPFVPRVTLTFEALASTREMLFLVSGHDKAPIMTRLLSGEDLPAARAGAAYGKTVWLLDEAATP
ncbi:6-phosphogluconolactonase [Afipia sp. Root123D2]|uniref:6-phosphogluconolactonase n=1 Tax=Afipia sp. Root123D2 TaxID=1736436 RepID=UPI0006F3C117|nr:6-phosphogluconolactonase [Afipia sp. Root123D2]KQW19214.1 6-phosphogluconolactonase [Afipia sp. Root123D2]